MKKLIALLLFPYMAWGQVDNHIVEDKSLPPVHEDVVLEYKDDQVEEDNLWPEDYWHSETIQISMGDSLGTAKIRFIAGDGIEPYTNNYHLWIMPKSDTTFYWRSGYEVEILELLEMYEKECQPTFAGFIKWLKARK